MTRFASWLSLEPLERRPGLTVLAIATLFGVLYLTALTVFPRGHGRIVDGDTIQYYAYLRSFVIDGDLDFTNDYLLLYGPPEAGTENVWLTSRTPIGRATNLMSVGPALLWAPFFLATYLGLVLLRPFGIVVPLDGIAAPFPLSAGVAGIVYAGLGAYFCYRSCRVLVPAGPAWWATVVAWLATPAIYYSLVAPAYSHSASLFASALFCYVWLRTRGGTGVGRYVLLGALGGLAALVRWQDVVILVLPAAELLQGMVKGRHTLATAATRALAMAGAVAVALTPQLLAWHAVYGQFIVMPQGDGFMRWSSPAIVSVLFSFRHGLFTWTPALLLAVAGFYALVKRDPWLGWSTIVVVALAVYVNASVSDWWAGEAFGARRFVGYTVFFSLGLAAAFGSAAWRAGPSAVRWVAVAAVTYNLLFLLQYQLFMRGFEELAPYPTTWQEVFVDRLVLPWHLLRAWLT